MPDSKNPHKYQQHRDNWDPDFNDHPHADQWVPLEDFLVRCGNKLNCHFTIERMDSTATLQSALEVAGVFSEEVATIDQLILKLQKELDSVVVLRYADRPSVIRIVESKLFSMKGYPLSQKITIKFSGKIDRMVSEIHKMVDNVGLITSDGRVLWSNDTVTKVDIAFEDKSILFVLTNSINLTANRRIIWESLTVQDKSKEFTLIHYVPTEKSDKVE